MVENIDTEKWYNKKGRIIWYIIFWPILPFWIYNTELISKKEKYLYGSIVAVFFIFFISNLNMNGNSLAGCNCEYQDEYGTTRKTRINNYQIFDWHHRQQALH